MEWLQAVAMHPVTLVGVGSAVGGNARYFVGRWAGSQPWAVGLPVGTFLVNVTGSLLFGFVAVWFLERLLPPRRELYLLLGTGLCGGYTTFSALEWETYVLVREGNWPTAVINVVGSIAAGLVGVVLGVLAAHLVLGQR